MAEEGRRLRALLCSLPYSFFDMYNQLPVSARPTLSFPWATSAFRCGRSVDIAPIDGGFDADKLQLLPFGALITVGLGMVGKTVNAVQASAGRVMLPERDIGFDAAGFQPAEEFCPAIASVCR